MSRDKILVSMRNEKIKAAYAKLEAEKIGAQQKYRHLAILELLSKQFFLAPGTIQDIICMPDLEAENPNQITLFEE